MHLSAFPDVSAQGAEEAIGRHKSMHQQGRVQPVDDSSDNTIPRKVEVFGRRKSEGRGEVNHA